MVFEILVWEVFVVLIEVIEKGVFWVESCFLNNGLLYWFMERWWLFFLWFGFDIVFLFLVCCFGRICWIVILGCGDLVIIFSLGGCCSFIFCFLIFLLFFVCWFISLLSFWLVFCSFWCCVWMVLCVLRFFVVSELFLEVFLFVGVEREDDCFGIIGGKLIVCLFLVFLFLFDLEWVLFWCCGWLKIGICLMFLDVCDCGVELRFWFCWDCFVFVDFKDGVFVVLDLLDLIDDWCLGIMVIVIVFVF